MHVALACITYSLHTNQQRDCCQLKLSHIFTVHRVLAYPIRNLRLPSNAVFIFSMTSETVRSLPQICAFVCTCILKNSHLVRFGKIHDLSKQLFF